MQTDMETLEQFKDNKIIEFINNLEDLFTEYSDDEENKDSVLNSMRFCLYSLPRYTVSSDKIYIGNRNYENLSSKAISFRNSLKNPEVEFYEYILSKLAEIFFTGDYSEIFKHIVKIIE